MRSTPFHAKVFALAGIVALLVQMNAVPLDYLLFRLNKDHISKALCEHKAPNCNGHCFLMKQMAKANNAAKDKNTERVGGQLDGHFLLAALDNLTLYPSQASFFTGQNQSLRTGWHNTPHQPPRFVA